MVSSSLFREEATSERQGGLHGEVILKQPLSTKFMVVALLLCIGVATTWVVVGDYARTEQVRGFLITSKPSSRVYVPRYGIVSVLDVSEGDQVKEGARLATVHTDFSNKKGRSTAAQGLESIRQRLDLTQEQSDIVLDRGREEVFRLEAQVLSNDQRIRDTKSQIDIQREIVASNKKLFEQVEALIKSGFVSGVEYERRRQDLLSAQQALGRLQSELNQFDAETARIQSELKQVKWRLHRNLRNLILGSGLWKRRASSLKANRASLSLHQLQGV